MTEAKMKTLVLCVDHDNDIGVKAGIKTPIIGKESNLEAATKLVLNDPEESDANAIFGAIRTYDSLIREPNDGEYQVATIAGSEFGGITADIVLRDQLTEVLKQFPSEYAILVSDGYGDETVIPIIQSHVPILSIQRVVVKQSQRIEESWAIFSRYLARLLGDPYYGKWILGAPGILLLALATLLIFASEYVGIVVLTFAGGLLVIKGFNIDKTIGEWIVPSPPNLIRLFTAVAAMIIIGLDIYQTYPRIVDNVGEPSVWLSNISEVVGWAMYFAIDLLVVASCISLVGSAIYFFFMRDPRIWWTLVGTVVTLWMREVSLTASRVLLTTPPIPMSLLLQLVLIVGLGIFTTVITILVTRDVSKRFEHYFTRAEGTSR